MASKQINITITPEEAANLALVFVQFSVVSVEATKNLKNELEIAKRIKPTNPKEALNKKKRIQSIEESLMITQTSLKLLTNPHQQIKEALSPNTPPPKKKRWRI